MADDAAFSVRAARLADTSAIRECAAAAYAHYIPRMGRPPGPMLEDYTTLVATQQVFVGEARGDMFGYVVLLRRDANVLLDNVAVWPRYQGQGLGKRLITFAETQARRYGAVSIELYTHECMVENVDLYERLGYRETARRTVSGYHRIYLRKPLDADRS